MRLQCKRILKSYYNSRYDEFHRCSQLSDWTNQTSSLLFIKGWRCVRVCEYCALLQPRPRPARLYTTSSRLCVASAVRCAAALKSWTSEQPRRRGWYLRLIASVLRAASHVPRKLFVYYIGSRRPWRHTDGESGRMDSRVGSQLLRFFAGRVRSWLCDIVWIW